MSTTPAVLITADDSDEADEKGFQNDQHLKPLETGLLAWSQVLAGALGNCMSWGNAATFGVYQLHYQETLHLPSSQISWIGSIQVFLTFLLCAVAGRLADAGHTRATVCAGTFLSVLGILATSFATEYWHIFLAQGICTGLGLGLLFMPCVSVISSYFYRRRPFALALAATGSGFGSVAFPAVVQYLTPQVGFAWAVRCHALLALIIAGSECLLLRPRLAGRKKGPLFEWDAFMEPTYFLFAVGTFLFFWVLYFGYFYINAYARNVIGFDTVSSVQLLIITNAMGIPVRPVAGWISNNVAGPINTYVVSMFILGAMQFAWIGVHDRVGMYLFSVFFGVAAAASQCVFIGALASLTDDPTKMGARSGIVYLLSAFATLAGPPTAGAIIDRSGGDYFWAQVWGGMGIAVSAFTVAGARYCKTGMVWGVKV
ncbi:major facilitator superfamily domain-containing protein [Plectosphaerella plurivora]|uniref:Major facilitator superfamily domain-containing protein n=1 Tax=Plectosphaerella plurivora TaxID=936078 RepID=A0A9P8V2E5_9PEZI|nr:major facilitator superfamily domain-containing protein [Plectosphaerella plurivora]